jgi:hypothetical protein
MFLWHIRPRFCTIWNPEGRIYTLLRNVVRKCPLAARMAACLLTRPLSPPGSLGCSSAVVYRCRLKLLSRIFVCAPAVADPPSWLPSGNFLASLETFVKGASLY